MPKYHIPNPLPENYELHAINSSQKFENENEKRISYSFFDQMKKLFNRKYLGHPIYLSAYNNIGKFSHSSHIGTFLWNLMKIRQACMILSPISGLLYNLIVNMTGAKKYGLVG